jgi:hypothetical protein
MERGKEWEEKQMSAKMNSDKREVRNRERET